MVGKKVVHKTYMSAKEAHYVGGLVNGARIVVQWGDVGTELMVDVDGDISLFLGYEKIEFRAPVYVGDFMEYHGWFEKVGNSSRRMFFEAYKVIEAAKGEGLAVSAANVLNPPVLVGRADGICVVPKDCQRGAQDPAFKLD